MKGDLFISIHLNSALDLRAQGGEFYFQNQLPPEEESLFLANLENQADTETLTDDEAETKPHTTGLALLKEDLEKTFQLYMSRELAKTLRSEWKTQHGIAHALVKQGPFHVISSVPMPSLLVELGFISHPKESRWLADPVTHQKLTREHLSRHSADQRKNGQIPRERPLYRSCELTAAPRPTPTS